MSVSSMCDDMCVTCCVCTYAFRTTLVYDGKSIVDGKSGTDYSEFLEQMGGKQNAPQKLSII